MRIEETALAGKFNRRRFIARATAAAGASALGSCAPTILRAADAAWGDLVGRLVYDGTPPERRKLTVDKDVQCCGKFDIRDESLMVGPERGLANVFVYARTRRLAICPELAESAPKRVTLDNVDCIFKPHCMSLWVGKQEFYIINSDPIAQNVTFSPLGEPIAANFVLAPATGKDPKNIDATYQFTRAQLMPVPIACNYHPWESAHILPRDNPYVAISGMDGSFHIAKLPVGTVEFVVWQERVRVLKTPRWPNGRFQVSIQPGTIDLGTIKIPPACLEKQ